MPLASIHLLSVSVFSTDGAYCHLKYHQILLPAGPKYITFPSMIEIKEVTTKKERKEFVIFPFSLYNKESNWIPPLISDELSNLDPKKNPAFDHCEMKQWLAYKDGKVVGRIVGIINHAYVKAWNKKDCRFGWIDFIDDPTVSGSLIETVENWARENKMEALCGPLGFTDMDEEGMLIEGFEELGTLATIYNHPYYPKHLEALDYSKDADWIEYEVQVPSEIPERLSRINDQVLKRSSLKLFKPKNRKELLSRADGMFEVLNQAYSELYGFVKLTKSQVDYYVKQYFGFINPDFVPVVLDQNDRVVAFGVAMPSLSNAFKKARGKLFPFGIFHILKALKWEKTLDLYLVAVLPEYQKKGLNSILMIEMNRSAIKHGMIKSETNVELETNEAVQSMWKNFERRQHKRRRVFIKELVN